MTSKFITGIRHYIYYNITAISFIITLLHFSETFHTPSIYTSLLKSDSYQPSVYGALICQCCGFNKVQPFSNGTNYQGLHPFMPEDIIVEVALVSSNKALKQI